MKRTRSTPDTDTSSATHQPAEQKPRLDAANPDPSSRSPTLALESPSPDLPHSASSSSPKTISGSEYGRYGDKWGFVVYRTTYSDEEKWWRAKARLFELAVETQEDAIGEARGDFSTAALKFVEDREGLEGKSSMDVRKIHNPFYDPEIDEQDGDEDDLGDTQEVALDEYGGLDSSVCVMVDEKSMESLLEDDDGERSYVIAIDARTTMSEMDVVQWDGTMKIHAPALMHDFYLCCVGNGALVMGEIHDPEDPEEIWIGH